MKIAASKSKRQKRTVQSSKVLSQPQRLSSRMSFELKPKSKTVTIRMSEELLDAVKEKARKNGIDYQKFIRIALESFVEKQK